jgi:hypothetical protein
MRVLTQGSDNAVKTFLQFLEIFSDHGFGNIKDEIDWQTTHIALLTEAITVIGLTPELREDSALQAPD